MGTDSEDRDIFENSYYYFIQSVEVLAAPPEKACELLGQFNVCFETKWDIEAGCYLFNSVYCPFSSEQINAITSLIEGLSGIPDEILKFTESPEKSLENMRHSCWIPLRE